jgi:hypothetical protein
LADVTGCRPRWRAFRTGRGFYYGAMTVTLMPMTFAPALSLWLPAVVIK